MKNKNFKFKEFFVKLFLNKDYNGIFTCLLSIPLLIICICLGQPAYYIVCVALIAIVNFIIKKVVSAHLKKKILPNEINKKGGSANNA